MAPTVPLSFVDHGLKLRVLILAIGDWPEMARNRGEPPENDPYLGNRNCFGGGLNRKVVALGILVICPVDKNRASITKS